MRNEFMEFGPYHFNVEKASFRYVSSSHLDSGWDFNFSGECVDDEDNLFPYGFRLYTESAPMALENQEDLSGVEVILPEPFDEESGEPLFGFNVWEEHEVFDLTLRFLQKDEEKYLVEISATIAETVLGKPTPLHLRVWTQRLPDDVS